MFEKILIIPKESKEQTIETIKVLPHKIQVQLALYIVKTEELCDIINAGKGLVKYTSKNASNYREIYKALIDKDNYVIPL